ncbi:MAG: hypothetical protein H7123_06720 [Thermoleophilia bacterium]|nr:hypothetical protein [Thermoleophilia bacterium]
MSQQNEPIQRPLLTIFRVVAGAAALAALAFLVTDNSASQKSTMPAQSRIHPSGMVEVTLGNRYLVLAVPTVKAGTVRVTVKNAGRVPHEVIFLKRAAPGQKLRSGTNHQVNEAGLIGSPIKVTAYAARTVLIKLTPGSYQVVCNYPGHFMSGVHAPLTVT